MYTVLKQMGEEVRVVVASIVRDGPAATAGMGPRHIGWEIMTLDGERISASNWDEKVESAPTKLKLRCCRPVGAGAGPDNHWMSLVEWNPNYESDSDQESNHETPRTGNKNEAPEPRREGPGSARKCDWTVKVTTQREEKGDIMVARSREMMLAPGCWEDRRFLLEDGRNLDKEGNLMREGESPRTEKLSDYMTPEELRGYRDGTWGRAYMKGYEKPQREDQGWSQVGMRATGPGRVITTENERRVEERVRKRGGSAGPAILTPREHAGSATPTPRGREPVRGESSMAASSTEAMPMKAERKRSGSAVLTPRERKPGEEKMAPKERYNVRDKRMEKPSTEARKVKETPNEGSVDSEKDKDSFVTMVDTVCETVGTEDGRNEFLQKQREANAKNTPSVKRQGLEFRALIPTASILGWPLMGELITYLADVICEVAWKQGLAEPLTRASKGKEPRRRIDLKQNTREDNEDYERVFFMLAGLRSTVCGQHNRYYMPLKGAVRVSEFKYDQSGMNYPKKRGEEAYDRRVPLTEGTLVDSLAPYEDFVKGEKRTKAMTQDEIALMRENYGECAEVEAELHARREACTAECKKETRVDRTKACERLGLRRATPGKQCICGAMYLPAPMERNQGVEGALDPRDDEAEEEVEGGKDASRNFVGHTLKMANWTEHGFNEKQKLDQREDSLHKLAARNVVGWAKTQKTKNQGLLAGEDVEMGDDNQPMLLPIAIQETRKLRRVEGRQERHEDVAGARSSAERDPQGKSEKTPVRRVTVEKA